MSEYREKFIEYYGGRVPHYTVVRREHPDFFESMMRRFGGYRAFLRRFKFKMPPQTKKEKKFIRMSSRSARRYFSNGEWSRLERQVEPVLKEVCRVLGLEHYHNFRYPSMKGKGFYKFDFLVWQREYPIAFMPLSVVRWVRVECDGIFHKIPSSAERDRDIDAWLLTRGIQTVRVKPWELKGKKRMSVLRLRAFLRREIQAAIRQLI